MVAAAAMGAKGAGLGSGLDVNVDERPSRPSAASSDQATPATGVSTAERLECAAITLTLAFAIVNPGTGYLSGFFVGFVVTGVIWVRHLRWWRSETIDVLMSLAVLITLLSPYWHLITAPLTSPSHGAVVSLAFFVAVRIVVTSSRCFRELVAQISILCAAYAVYFLLNAQSYDLINGRASVSFSNANVTGAILAFGGVASIFLVVSGGESTQMRRLWVAIAVVDTAAIYVAGARASFAGLVLALLVMWGWRHWSRVLNDGVLVALVIGFFIALVPNSISLFFRLTLLFSVIPTFQRGDESSANGSGRREIWSLALHHVDDAWLTGWGPGNYYLPVGTDPTFAAHSWAVEYLLSVGVLGTAVIAAVMYLAYTRARSGVGGLWTTATAVCLLPIMSLSAFQWTLWPWLAFALWSRADVLGLSPGDPERVEGSTGSPGAELPEPSARATAG